MIGGITNKGLRGQVAGLLGTDYTRAQMTYDLRRLRLKGLVTRLPHSNTYVLTADGQRVAIFYTKVHNRLLRPLLAADQRPAPHPYARPCASSTTTSTPTSTQPASPPDSPPCVATSTRRPQNVAQPSTS